MEPVQIERIEDFVKKLNEEELRWLYDLIYERLKMISQERSSREMQVFNIGDWVSFTPGDGRVRIGRVTKLNKRTVQVTVSPTERWKVGPSLLRLLTNKDE